jgi:hypothetical protein
MSYRARSGRAKEAERLNIIDWDDLHGSCPLEPIMRSLRL